MISPKKHMLVLLLMMSFVVFATLGGALTQVYAPLSPSFLIPSTIIFGVLTGVLTYYAIKEV